MLLHDPETDLVFLSVEIEDGVRSVAYLELKEAEHFLRDAAASHWEPSHVMLGIVVVPWIWIFHSGFSRSQI